MYHCGYLFCFSFVPVDCFENKQLFFAKRLNEAMKVVTVLLLSVFMLKCGYFESQTFFSFSFFLFFETDVTEVHLLVKVQFSCRNTESKVGKSNLTAALHQLLELSLVRLELK